MPYKIDKGVTIPPRHSHSMYDDFYAVAKAMVKGDSVLLKPLTMTTQHLYKSKRVGDVVKTKNQYAMLLACMHRLRYKATSRTLKQCDGIRVWRVE